MLDLLTLAADSIEMTPGTAAAGAGALGTIWAAVKLGDRLWRQQSTKNPPATSEGNAERLDAVLARDCPRHHQQLSESVTELTKNVAQLTNNMATGLEIARLRHEQQIKQLDRIEADVKHSHPSPQT